MRGKLPPLPGSDTETLRENKYDGFYKTTPRSLWQNAERELIKEKKRRKCDHYFVRRGKSAYCRNCHVGYDGKNLEIKDGKLFFKGKKVF